MPDRRGARVRRGLGPLGRRLLAAFALVSVVSVALLVVAAQQAVERGLSAVRDGGKWAIAQDLAHRAAGAFDAADGWADADLGGVLDAATDAGVAVAVVDADGAVVVRSTSSSGLGPGRLAAGSAGSGPRATVTVGGVEVGEVVVGGGPPSDAWVAARAEARGRDLAWSWILAAALASLAFAVLAAWFVTRALTRPLTSLAGVAHRFAAGERGVRAEESAAGELGELARGFNDAAESVERSAAQRRQMAADVAHELRTPLAALQAGLEEVRDGLVPADVATLTRLHDQSVRLGRVVDDLRLLAAPGDEPIGMVNGRVDLARVVADELSAREPELRAAGLAVREVDLAPVQVVADADRMHQVVGNVLANCARHCRPGDAVDVLVARAGADALVRVSDTGPGIAQQDLTRVFDRYWRGPTGGVGGSGLGLAVVREIVTAHHGTADVASTGGGTVVTIRLPAAGSA
jgi:two-component system sensor histidine kinase BaeS